VADKDMYSKDLIERGWADEKGAKDMYAKDLIKRGWADEKGSVSVPPLCLA